VLTLAFALVLTMVGNGRREEAVLRDCYLIKHYLMDFLIGQLIQSLLKSSLIEEPICGVGGLDLPTSGFFVLQLPTLSCQRNMQPIT
jgi:hypothetical protein